MDKLMSGTLLKWLKWPPDKRLVFFLACIVISIIFAADEIGEVLNILLGGTEYRAFSARYILLLNHRLFVFLRIFLEVVFLGLLTVGWLDKLWVPVFIRVLFFTYTQIVEHMINGYSFLPFLLGRAPYTLFWSVIIVILWAIPRHLMNKARQTIEENPDAEVARPEYKHSFFGKLIWILFWGLALLINIRWIEARLANVDWSNAITALFTFQENEYFFFDVSFDDNILAINLLPSLIWAVIALFALIDSTRKDANYFYAGFWVFTIWHVVKLGVFLFTSLVLPADLDEIVLIPLLVGGSVLLRAAMGRPLLEAVSDW